MKTTGACLRFGLWKQCRPYRSRPDFVARCVHVQTVKDKDVFWPAILEHRRDDIDIVQIRALVRLGAYPGIDLALQGKFSKAHLRRLERDKVDGCFAQ